MIPRKLSILAALALGSSHIAAQNVVTITTERVGDDIEAHNGSLFSSDYGGVEIRRITTDGTISVIDSSVDKNGAIAVADDGTIYTTNYDRGFVRRISTDGAIDTVATQLPGPAGISVASDGSLIVTANAAHAIVRIAPVSWEVSVVFQGKPLDWPTGIVLDDADRIYVANMFSGEIVRVVDGEAEVVAALPAEEGAYNLGYLAWDGNRLFVAHLTESSIYQVLENGESSRFAGTGQQGGEDGPVDEASFLAPTGLALLEGKLYVTDGGDESPRLRMIDLTMAGG